jgi:hypothetical protein
MDAVVYANDAVPITVKLPLIVPPVSGRYAGAYDAVSAYEALTAFLTYDAVSA